MNQISTIPGKLLFIVYNMYNEGSITQHQRGFLKDLIFQKSDIIDYLYQCYLQDGTELTLKIDLLKLVRDQTNVSTPQKENNMSKSNKLNRIKKITPLKIPQRNIQKISWR